MERDTSANTLARVAAAQIISVCLSNLPGCGGRTGSSKIDGTTTGPDVGTSGSIRDASTEENGAPLELLEAIGSVWPVQAGSVYVGSWYFDADRQSFVRPTGCNWPPLVVPYSPDVYGNRKLMVSPYFLQETPVTNGLYGLCVAAAICEPPDHDIGDPNPKAWNDPSRKDLPVSVNHYQAQTYCGWIRGRLPSTAELYRAAQGDSPVPGVAALTSAAIDCYGRTAPGNDANALCGQLDLMDYKALSPPPLYRVGGFEMDRGPFNHLDLFGSVGEWSRTIGGEGASSGLCDVADGSQDFVTLADREHDGVHDVLEFATAIIEGVKFPGYPVMPAKAFPDATTRYNVGFRCAFDENPYGGANQ